MIIKGAKTIEEYRQIQAEKIQNWIDSNFCRGFCDMENGRSECNQGYGQDRRQHGSAVG